MKPSLIGLALAAAALFCTDVVRAATANDFRITNRKTGADIRRDDFKGKILLLDFFAYWCPPCRTSSPVVEREIAEHYRQRGGNPHGVAVEVIGVNVERSNPHLTDEYIKNAGLINVANDFMAPDGAWAQFGQGGIPHFVIINGAGGGSHAQWEILHSAPGFRGAEFYRAIIDTIRPGTAENTSADLSVQLRNGTRIRNGSGAQKFGQLASGVNRNTRTYVICNRGTERLDIQKLAKVGRHSSDFIIISPRNLSLAPGECTTFKVGFRPRSPGVRTATIRIVSSDPDESSFNIRLIGTGSPN
jgi:thiol-disulfide isomerase/thioredoxin